MHITIDSTLDEVLNNVHAALINSFRYAVLSTMNGQQPRSRYVVMRDVDLSFHITIFTDARSAKVEELHANPQCSLLFFNNEEGLQLRLEGEMELHQSDELTNRYWKKVTDQNSYSYRSILAPGTEIETPANGHEWSTAKYFCVLRFIPATMDILQLDGREHIRARFIRAESGWKGTWTVP